FLPVRKHALHARRIYSGENRSRAQVAPPLGRLGGHDVTAKGRPVLDLAVLGDSEALGSALVRLNLRHIPKPPFGANASPCRCFVGRTRFRKEPGGRAQSPARTQKAPSGVVVPPQGDSASPTRGALRSWGTGAPNGYDCDRGSRLAGVNTRLMLRPSSRVRVTSGTSWLRSLAASTTRARMSCPNSG